MAKKLVKNYVFTAGKGLNDNIAPLAYAKILANRTFLIKEINALVAYRVSTNYSASYTGYIYSVAKCERDTGYVIDALLKDIKYGGNENIWLTSSKYYDGVTPLIAGDRVPEADAYTYATTLINTYILTNTAVPSPYQNLNTQVINSGTVAEAGVTTRVSTLLTNVQTVILNGLGSLPTLDVRLARIEILGKVSLADLLLITDVSQNVVIYNFSDPSKGGTVEFTAGNSLSYPTATTANNGVTIIRFTFNTEALLSTDIIQIFLESTELRVRPYDFGTDAIERMRVAQPQAMLDADFEYGLQPTKWQAIGMQRGYPATYELPGTDLVVLSVTTDASTGTAGIGQSLMTVTTQSAHGFAVGTPFTIKALNSSVLGFNRSEGTFIVIDALTSTTFRYYAKAKVGSSNGQTMATTNTQLRQAAFYTGASVGTPTFSVVSNGAAVNITTALQTVLGGNTLTFIGTKPSVGAPLTGTGIVTNTQISGVFGETSGNGKLGTYYVKTTQATNESFIDLTSVTNIVTNMAVSDRSGTPIALEITSIGGSGLSATQINLNSPVTTSLRGDVSAYNGGANQQAGTGTGCTLNISKSAGSYTVTGIAAPGTGYAVGDTLQVLGTNLGYSGSGAGNLLVNVASVTTGGVTAVTIISGLSSGTGSYSAVATQNANGQGYGNTWSISRAGGVYTVGASSYTNSAQFFVGNRLKVAGTNFEGATPANDLTITITSVSGGVITGTSVSGTAIRGDTVDVYNTFTISAPTTGIVPAGTVVTGSAIALLQVDFASNHGFVPGTGLNIVISSTGTNHGLAGGPFFVEEITGPSSIRYTARTTGTIDGSTAITGTVYVRPDSFFSHRPYDGGVQLGTGGPQHGGHAIRMSKKYIRYQSGKGAMYNTGALFAPAFDIRSITASALTAGSLITVTLDEVDHGCQSGAIIRLIGITTAGYNGDYIVDDVIDERSFVLAASTSLAATTAVIGSQCQMSLLKWHGSTVRSGPFDDQNGIFFQYDGQTFSVGRRTSTFQIAGNIALNSDSNAVTGTNTRFSDQLQAGDRIVIKGMTHIVATIASQTSMTVTPDFRGVTNITGAKVCKVQDLIINQSDFNLDKIDGTGPSGYTLDITKMQMIGIQFSWYGAGFIDWMIRGPEGNYTFIHRLKGNNLNTEAYMRTGNLPVRYEVLNEGARAKLVGQLSSSATSMSLETVVDFPTAGTVYVDNELISYTGKNLATKQLTGLSRSANLSNFAAGAVRSYSAGAAAVHDDKQGVVLVSGLVSPIISHWGSAYLIDGLFDSDRGYLFTYASTGISISTTKVTAFLLRLAPSVSNATTGDLGERELLNRAQLLLQEISITVDSMASGASAIVVEGVLNPVNYPLNPSNIVWGGLQSLSAGGQPSFSQIAPGGSVSWSTNASVITTTATTTAQMAATLVVPNNTGFNVAANNNFAYVTATSWEASGATPTTSYTTLRAGIIVSGAGFPAGTVITQVQAKSNFAGIDYYFLRFSQNHSQALNANNTFTINLGGATGAVQSFAYFTQATWEASGASAGTIILDAKFPANTRVSSISGLLNFGGTAYYLVTFTQNTNTSIIAGGTVTFSFTQPAYALPGETVFSLQVNPGASEKLDLSQLKELTTTAIGGRGTFPNGPDTLAINVYKVSGTAVTGNIILRWGEAQA